MIPFFITGTLLLVVLVFFMAIFLIFFKNKQNKIEKEALQASIDDKERAMHTISMELHDNVVQMMNLIKMHIHVLRQDAETKLAIGLNPIENILDTLILDVHNMSYSLNTELLKKRGLLLILEQELEWVNASKKITATLDIKGKKITFSPEKELMIIRIAQEAINNTIKYAYASTLEIRLSYQEKMFKMEIVDNGKGFDLHSKEMGIGIQSMRQRTNIINGTLEIVSAENAGTSVVLVMPIE